MTKQKLKYGDDISAFDPDCANCPPGDAMPRSLKAYRWVFQPMGASCFLPPGAKNPRRINNSRGAANCGLFGVSMHTSQQHSIDAFKKLESSFLNARKSMGGYVAEGSVSIEHGLCTIPNGVGHFDIYEYKSVNLNQFFVISGEIPK